MLASLVIAAVVAQPAVLLFPAVGTTSRVTVSGRVLKNASNGGSSKISKNLRRLTSSNWEGAEVDVRFLTQQQVVRSGHDGNFEVTFVAAGKPFEYGLWTAEAGVKGAEPGRATVDILDDAAPFFVISDFDDTLAVTNVVDKPKFVEAVFSQDELTQPVVPGMAAFYDCLRAKPHKPVFALVSGSPVQFVPRVQRFLMRHGFPVFGLYLRDLGPKTLSDYKQPIIRSLMAALPKTPVVLIGDSGEHDPEIYAQMRAEFPDRVKAIFIRDAGRATDAARFTGMTLFKTADEAAKAAAQVQLVDTKCANAIDGGLP